MSDQRFVEKTESFLKEIRLKLPPPESFETIDNMKVTINEYREFAQPYSATWHDYVFNVFHILGFKTKIETKRIITLSCIGDSESRKAVIILINEHEGFHDIIPGLEWSTFLFFTMHYFQVEWGILTDGIEFRLIHRDHNFNKVFLHGNLDEIICDNKFDDFYAFYNIMSLVLGKKSQPVDMKTRRNVIKKPVSISTNQSGSFDISFHLENKHNNVITMIDVLRSRILGISDEIEERIYKTYIGYYAGNSICQVRTQSINIKIWVNLGIHQIDDPLGLCRDVRSIGHYGTGDTEINISNFEEIEYVLDIIRKSYKSNRRKVSNISRNKKANNKSDMMIEFWTQLLENANQQTDLFINRNPRRERWIDTNAGIKGLKYAYVIYVHDARVELYIDNGERSWNKKTFNFFFNNKEEIEEKFGEVLDWQLKEDQRYSRIFYLISGYGLKDEDYWSELQDLMIEAMIRLEKAFRPFIDNM